MKILHSTRNYDDNRLNELKAEGAVIITQTFPTPVYWVVDKWDFIEEVLSGLPSGERDKCSKEMVEYLLYLAINEAQEIFPSFICQCFK